MLLVWLPWLHISCTYVIYSYVLVVKSSCYSLVGGEGITSPYQQVSLVRKDMGIQFLWGQFWALKTELDCLLHFCLCLLVHLLHKVWRENRNEWSLYVTKRQSLELQSKTTCWLPFVPTNRSWYKLSKSAMTFDLGSTVQPLGMRL